MSGKTPLRFPLVLFLILIPILNQIDLSAAKKTWCCRGWSDDMSKPGQADTFECDFLCQGETSCTDSTNKDCATSWDCASSGQPNKTDEDCSKPDAGKECFCDTPWCNCPQALKNKETPYTSTKLNCCLGSSKDAPEKLKKEECVQPNYQCLGEYDPNAKSTNFRCSYTNNGRLREECNKFSAPKEYHQGSLFCRCNTDYCNCPSGQKPNPGGGADKIIVNAQFGLFFWSSYYILTLDSWFSFWEHLRF